MHTSAFESCRIHHDGDFENEIIITNMDSTSKAIGIPSDIKITVRELVNFQRRLEKSPGVTVSIRGLKDHEITILQKDIENFLAIRLISKIEEKINNVSYATLVHIARELGIEE